MAPEIPTDKLALQIWWAMMWRAIPAAILAGILVGIVIGIISAIVGADPNALQVPSALAGGLLGIYVMVKIIKRLMTNGFSVYRLAVVKK